jgi:hypothetical protein
MTTYHLRVPAEDVVRLVRAERDAAGGEPELHVNASRDYAIEEEYDRRAHGLDAANRRVDPGGKPGTNEYDLVTEVASLTVEPRIERDYWMLSVVIRRSLGPQIAEAARALAPADLTLEDFEGLLAPERAADASADVRHIPAEGQSAPAGGRSIEVRLETASPQARENFEGWWAEMTGRHAARSEAPPLERAPHEQQDGSAEDAPGASPWSENVREAVGVFGDTAALEHGMDALEHAGFERAKISVLGAEAAIGRRIERLYHVEPETGADAETLRNLRIEGAAATIAMPLNVGGLGGATAVIGSGGALAAAVADAIERKRSGDAPAADIGAMLATAVGPRHADRVRDQLAHGGAAVWLALYNEASENRALAVLDRAGARDIHVHEIPRGRQPGLRPTPRPQLDPFLGGHPGD